MVLSGEVLKILLGGMFAFGDLVRHYCETSHSETAGERPRRECEILHLLLQRPSYIDEGEERF